MDKNFDFCTNYCYNFSGIKKGGKIIPEFDTNLITFLGAQVPEINFKNTEIGPEETINPVLEVPSQGPKPRILVNCLICSCNSSCTKSIEERDLCLAGFAKPPTPERELKLEKRIIK